jgi:pimeloyl-ACP methyl ester carboxylesterase
VPELADDLLQLLRALDAVPAILFGRSYGGTIALDLALRHPESVLAVALLEAGLPGLSQEYDEWFESLRATLEHTVAERGLDAVGEVVVRDVFGAWEELPSMWRDVFTANSPALLAEVRGGETLSDGSRLEELRVPALVVGAEGSPEPIQRFTEALERALPRAQTARVAGDHAIDPAGPDVLAFVRQVLAGAPSGAA